MKKFIKYALLVFAATSVFFACNKVDIEEPQNEEDFYYTFVLGNPETRSVLASDENGKYGNWEEGDRLGTGVNDSNPGYSNIIPGSPVTFKIYKQGGLKANDVVYAYYPFNNTTTSVESVAFDIPVDQNQDGTTFDFDAMPMVAEGFTVPAELESESTQTDVVGQIALVNLGSVIDFQVYSSNTTYAEETILNVAFAANSAIAGSFKKNITTVKTSDENTLAISGFTGTSVTTTVANAPSIGSSRAAAAHIYMVVAPSSEVTGSVIVTTNKAKYTYSLSTAQTFKRAGLKSFGLNLGSCQSRTEKDTPVPITGSFVLNDYYVANEKVNPLVLNSVVSLSTTTTGNSGKFFGSEPNRDWRLYQNDKAFVKVSVATGYELQSIQFTYGTDNGGALEGAASGAVLSVSGSSQTYNVINTGTATNGQVRLTAVSVNYIAVPVPEGYQLVENLDDVTSGQYIIAAKVDGSYYAMPNAFSAGKLEGVAVNLSSGVITTSDATDYIVSLTNSSNTCTITGNNNVLLGYSSSTNFNYTGTNTTWTLSRGTNGTFRLTNIGVSARVIAFNGTAFGAYAASNVTANSTSYYDIELFKFNGSVTTKTTPTTTVTPASPIALTVSGTQQLSVDTDSDGEITYESNATGVATVSASGLITAVAAGTATISVKTAETSTYSAGKTDITVNVSPSSSSTVAQVIAGGAGTYSMTDLLVYHKNGNSVIVGDETGKILLYKENDFAVGDKFDLTAASVVLFNNNIIEIDGWTSVENKTSGNTVNHGTALDLTNETDAQTLTTTAGYYSAKYVTIKGAQSNRTVDGSYVDVYLNSANAATDGMSVIVTGYIYSFNGTTHTIQVTSIEQDPDVAYIKATPATLSWGAAETDSKTITVVVNANGTGYTVSPTSDSDWNISDNGSGTITVSPKAANTSTTVAKTLTLTITNKDNTSVDQEVTCTQEKVSSGNPTSVSYDFTGNEWTVSNGTLSNGTVSFTGAGADNFKMNGGYFFMGKNDAYLTFPTYSSPVTKIVITGRSGASGSVKQNIFVGDTAVSTETTGATGANTYSIASGYQAAGTTYTLKVTSNHNTQITKIEVFF